MDSLTQIALGAAVGQAVLGRKVGYRAPLWGAICGTLPDLDVFIPMGGAVADFTYHRSFSHSLFVLTLISPLITWIILKLHPATTQLKNNWFVLVLAALITHPLLDSFTIYGTQLFWPLSEYPVALGSIFIIDPLYTLPLLIGVICALSLRSQPILGQRINQAGLLFSALYLTWSLFAQIHVTDIARQALANPNPDNQLLLATPAPFNTLLWRVLAMTETGYKEGFYSLLDQHRQIQFEHYPSQKELLESLQDHWPVSRLQWFSRGYYRVTEAHGDIIISDLRMGLEPDYVFNFKVGEISNPHPYATKDERILVKRDWGQLPALLRRIWNEAE